MQTRLLRPTSLEQLNYYYFPLINVSEVKFIIVNTAVLNILIMPIHMYWIFIDIIGIENNIFYYYSWTGAERSMLNVWRLSIANE